MVMRPVISYPMRWIIAFFFSFIALLEVLPGSSAKEYVDEQMQLIFSFPDQLELQELPTKEGSLSTIEISDGNDLRFEISSSALPMETILEDLQLRTLQPLEVSNYEILGATGIRISGNHLEDVRPIQALLFPRSPGCVSILSFGADKSLFENFLKSISSADEPSDIAGHRLRAEIDDAVRRGIFSGSTDPQTHRKVFRPDQGINRAELTKILVMASKAVTAEAVEDFFQEFLSTDDGSLFPDVDRSAWFAPPIFFAAKKGWVKGYPNGTFSPGGVVNVAETAKLILVSQGISVPADPEVWFRPFLQNFVSRNILQEEAEGYRLAFTTKVLHPSDWCGRAQAAAFLSRLLMLSDEKGKELFGKPLALETLPFIFSPEVPLEADDLGPHFRNDGREQTIQMLDRKGETFTPIVKVAVFQQQAWIDRKKDGVQPSLVPLYYLGENSDRVFAAESLCESLKTCTLPEADLLKTFSLR